MNREKEKPLCHSLGRPSRSDLVQLIFDDANRIFYNAETKRSCINGGAVFCGAKNSAAEAIARELNMAVGIERFLFEDNGKDAIEETVVRIEVLKDEDVFDFYIVSRNKSEGVDDIKSWNDEEWWDGYIARDYGREWVRPDENIWFKAVVDNANGKAKAPGYIKRIYDSENDSYKMSLLEPEYSVEGSKEVGGSNGFSEIPTISYVYKVECEGINPICIDRIDGYTVLFDNSKAENMYDFKVKYTDRYGKTGYIGGLKWFSSEGVAVPKGYNSYQMEIKPRTKCKLNSVKLVIDGEESNVSINTSGVAIFKIKETDLAKVSTVKFVVKASPLYKATKVVDRYRQEITCNSKKVYTVNPRESYILSGVYGDETDVDIKKIEVDGTLATATDNGDNTWNLAVLSKAGGRTVSVKLFDSEDEGAKPVDSFSLKVNPTITGVTIKNAKKSAAVTGGYYVNQEIGTTDVAYTIVRKSAEASSKDILSVNCINKVGGFTAKMSEDGKKILVSAPIRKDAEAVVEVINVNDSTDEESAVVGTFTVKTVAPAWAKNAPTVKAGTPSDINLNLNLTVPKGVVIPEGSDNYYYFLKAIPKVRTDEDDEGPAVKIEKATGKSQTIAYKVIDENPGEGHKANFNVSAYLIFVNDGEAPNDLDSANIAAVCKVGKLANATTYTPAYETKLALTKKTTTLYTGQEAIVAAPKYSKNTTHVDKKYLSASCVVWNYSTYEMENIASITEDGQVMVKVPAEGVTAGKYNVKVEYGVEGYQSLTVNLPITIVQGILSINAVYPSKVYTKDSKVTINPVITYNNGVNKPKSAKVTYVAYPEGDTEETPLPAGVTLNNKNGAITFAKGYEGPAINVVVKAADFKENTVVSDDVCTISPTSTKTKIGEVYLLTDPEKEESRIRNNNNIYTFNSLVVKDEYGTVIPEEDYTVSVSGAGKYSYGNPYGNIIATKSGLMKITVTAKDGGKSSKKIECVNYSIPVSIDESISGVGVTIYYFDKDTETYVPVEGGVVNNTAAPDDKVVIQLFKGFVTEATVSVTGGEVVNVVNRDYDELYYIIPTAAETKYTASYKASYPGQPKKGKVVVTINNRAFAEINSGVTVERTDNTQILGGRSVSEGGYRLDYKVNGLGALETNESYVAYVAFKNNKVNKTHPFYNCDSRFGHSYTKYKNDTKLAPITLDSDDEISIDLNDTVYTAGTYKNNEVQIYKKTETYVDGKLKYSYTPVSKIMSLPDITVTPYKKPSMKVAGSYTITKQAEEDGFALNISSLKNVKSIEIVEDGVQNAIVGGKLGEFTKYFSISDIEFNEKVGKYVVMVSVSGITGVDENDRTIIVPKAEDLVGFVTFRLTNEDGQYELMQVKIQVKIKK